MPSAYGQLSRAPRGRAQRWDGGWRGRASAVALSKPVMKYLSNRATNPIHARYYCGGNICLKCALKHTRRQRPRPLDSQARRGRWRDRPSKTHNATKRSMIAEVLGLIWRAAGAYSEDGDNCPMQLR